MQGPDNTFPAFDPDRPAADNPVSTETLIRALTYDVNRLVEALSPGVHGIPGTEQVPEGVNDKYAITTANSPYMHQANKRRTSLVIYNAGPDIVEFFFQDERKPDYTYGNGQPIPVGGEREIKATGRIYFVVSGTADIRIAEESS